MNLPGCWALHRDIEDRLGDDVSATGRADFKTLADGRIQWHESGTMHHTNADLPFTRTMYIQPAAEVTTGGGWEVTFDDGRLFYPWPGPEAAEHPHGTESAPGGAGTDSAPGTFGTGFVHLCAPDLYRGTFVAHADADEWTLRWEVTGPHKDYVMSTRYTRL